MATIEEIRDWVGLERQKIEDDERYHYPDATIDVNAPLALIQLSMKARMYMLNELEALLNGE